MTENNTNKQDEDYGWGQVGDLIFALIVVVAAIALVASGLLTKLLP